MDLVAVASVVPYSVPLYTYTYTLIHKPRVVAFARPRALHASIKKTSQYGIYTLSPAERLAFAHALVRSFAYKPPRVYFSRCIFLISLICFTLFVYIRCALVVDVFPFSRERASFFSLLPLVLQTTARELRRCRVHFNLPRGVSLISFLATWLNMLAKILVATCLVAQILAYDPNDMTLKDILLPEGHFEAFYLKGEEDNAARPPHLHGSFHKYKNPALINAPNSAAYGFRFDGKRRFNYD